MIFRLNKTIVVLILLFLNLLAPIISFFGYHNLYLGLVAGTGTVILVLFFAQKPIKTAFSFELLVFIFFVMSFIHLHHGYRYFVRMANDLSTLGLFATPFLLRNITEPKLKRSLFVLFLVSVLLFLYIIQFLSIDFIGVADRSYRSRELHALTQEMGFGLAFNINNIAAMCVAYSTVFLLFLPLIAKKTNKKSLYLILIVLFSQILFYVVFFQKRQNILELFVILVLAATVNRTLYSWLFTRNMFINIFAFGVIFYLILTLPVFELVFQRFATTAENIQQFDRFEEARNVLTEFEVINYFIGHGLGWASTKAVSTGSTIHIGYMNLFMKGGLLFVLLYFVQCAKNIRYCHRRSKLHPEYTVGVSITVFSMIQLMVAPGYGWYFQSIITGMAMFSRFFLNALVMGQQHTTQNNSLAVKHAEFIDGRQT